MTWAFSIILAIFFATCFLLGVRLGRRGRKSALTGALICFPFLILCAVLRHWPSAGYAFARVGPWAPLHPWWINFFAFTLLGIASSPVMSRRPRIILTTFGISYLLVVVFQLFGVHFWDMAQLDGKPGRDGVCPQSTGWSCGPAAAVTLLAQLGLKATEREMALLCRTEPWMGTNDVMLTLALREKALSAGYDFTVLRTNWQGLRSRRLPAIAMVLLPNFIIHYTVIVAVDEQHVTLADPMRGKMRQSREEFLSEWLNTLVTIAPGVNRPRAEAEQVGTPTH